MILLAYNCGIIEIIIMENTPPKINAQPPIEQEKIQVKPALKQAAGMPAVREATKHLMREMEVSKVVPTMNKVNQMDGFDCPGCAWPDPDDHRSALGEYCENGAKAIAEEATKKRVTPEFFEKYTVSELSQYTDYWLGKRGRLTHPMLLAKGSQKYEPISWQDAFELIGQQLKSLKSPDEAIFYTSGRTSNEAAFLYQLLARAYGTNNLPDCSNMCHESSGVALSETVGIGKGSVKLADFYQTDLIFVIGQNPGTNHPRMLSALQTAKENGAKIISVNPLQEAGLMGFKHPQKVSNWLTRPTTITDLYLQIPINKDIALLKAIMFVLLKREDKLPGKIFDKAFIQENTAGYTAFIDDLRQQNFKSLCADCGLEEKTVIKAALWVMEAEKIIICWAMGITQHKNGVDNIKEIVNLLLLKGSIGKPGAGTCPVRGHSNVQGDRTMGIWEKPKKSFLDRLAKTFNIDPPYHHGVNTVEAIKRMAEGHAKIFIAMGGNFLSASPDTEYTAKALQNCDLTVHVSTKLNRSHLVHGKTALILPCIARSEKDVQGGKEQFVSVENSMGVVHTSQGHLEPASVHLLSEPAIIAGIAKTTLAPNPALDWDALINDYDLIRDQIEKIVLGFEDYNERVRQKGGFYLPNGARYGHFKTRSGKAHFSVVPLPQHDLAADEYLMMTIRSHDQFNTTIYGLDDRYRGIFNGRRVVLMNAVDLAEAGLKEGDWVNLSSHYDGKVRVAECFMVISYNIPSKCIATYFPEANVLVPVDLKAKKSDTPASKSVKVKVELMSA